jgi:hypothetical protein
MQDEYDANAQTLKIKQTQKMEQTVRKNSNINDILGPQKILKSEKHCQLV